MNRKNRSDLKTKTLMIASFMKTIVLTLAILGMMTVTAHAAAFLQETPKFDNFETVTLLDNVTTVNVIDRSNDSLDTWDDTYGYGYTGNDYKAGSPASTDPFPDDYEYDSPVYYLGTFQGNDGVGDEGTVDLEKLIQYFLGDDTYEIYAYGKYDYDDTGDGSGTLVYEGGFNPLSFDLFDLDKETVTETDDDGVEKTTTEVTGGKWQITDSGTYAPGEKINFYSVKGANEFALYYVDPEHSSGTWTNRHLSTSGPSSNIPAMSHFSVMRTFDSPDSPPPGSSDPVPEPATMLLFGFSLMGLAGMARRRNSKF